jgi:prepilin-type processing-associated H-X9-DG protein
VESGARHMVPYQDYLLYWMSNEGSWGKGTDYGPCYLSWPSGWGGNITDSIVQDRLAINFYGMQKEHKAFAQSIGTTDNTELKLVQVEDPVNFVICGDMGVQTDNSSWGMIAYSDLCCLECSTACGWADWDLCTWATDCGLYYTAPNNGSFLKNPELRKPFARHLGGANMGFLDGHATWMNSTMIVTKGAEGDLAGTDFWGPTSLDPWTEDCYPTGGVWIF